MQFTLKNGLDTSEDNNVSGYSSSVKIAAIIALLVIVSAGTFAVIKQTNNKQALGIENYSDNIEVKRDVWKLYTLSDVKKELGNGAQASSNNASALHTCNYSLANKDPQKLKAITVLVRTSNKLQARQAYEVTKAANAVDVKDLGNDAYHNPNSSQLNILKNASWVIIVSTTGTSGKGTVDIPKSVAKTILSRI